MRQQVRWSSLIVSVLLSYRRKLRAPSLPGLIRQREQLRYRSQLHGLPIFTWPWAPRRAIRASSSSSKPVRPHVKELTAHYAVRELRGQGVVSSSHACSGAVACGDPRGGMRGWRSQDRGLRRAVPDVQGQSPGGRHPGEPHVRQLLRAVLHRAGGLGADLHRRPGVLRGRHRRPSRRARRRWCSTTPRTPPTTRTTRRSASSTEANGGLMDRYVAGAACSDRRQLRVRRRRDRRSRTGSSRPPARSPIATSSRSPARARRTTCTSRARSSCSHDNDYQPDALGKECSIDRRRR